ncbi:MAG: TetR/AcrR family transcriptional regulator, partial [Deltaproteobacteria bacterium]|nr:TetR/AcrR family transcriptional regulator [Deltaproteobacteria bacterium]
KGYHNVSMQEIAERTEFATGTLYKFFPSKEDLYRSLVLEKCESFELAIQNVLEAEADEAEKLRAYVETKARRLVENLAFVRLFLAESKGVGFNLRSGLDEELRQRYYAHLERLAAVFESGMKRGRFNPVAEPYALAVALDNVMDSFFLLWLHDPEKLTYPQSPDLVLDIFFKPLLAEQQSL